MSGKHHLFILKLFVLENRDTYNIIIDRLVHLVRTQFIQVEVVGSIPTLTARVSLFNHNFINIGERGFNLYRLDSLKFFLK